MRCIRPRKSPPLSFTPSDSFSTAGCCSAAGAEVVGAVFGASVVGTRSFHLESLDFDSLVHGRQELKISGEEVLPPKDMRLSPRPRHCNRAERVD